MADLSARSDGPLESCDDYPAVEAHAAAMGPDEDEGAGGHGRLKARPVMHPSARLLPVLEGIEIEAAGHVLVLRPSPWTQQEPERQSGDNGQDGNYQGEHVHILEGRPGARLA